VLVKSRELTGRTQTLPWWLGGEGVKTTENKIHGPPLIKTFSVFSSVSQIARWSKLDFVERKKCKPFLPRLSHWLGNMEKPVMSFYGTE
jgi:hypothetical protein